MPHPLDNPIWHALSTEQAYLAQGSTLAKRYPREVAAFAAMSEQSPPAYQALAQTLAGDIAALALDSELVPPADWATQLNEEIYQMVLEGPLTSSPAQPFRELTEQDVPAMLALTRLTEPGPFFRRTIELGSYIGIFDAGCLVAMAGERMHLSGFTEVSAVCTHPDFTGRGHARALMSAVVAGILSRGETPFLHVRIGNPAIGLYQKLGFKVRAQLHLAVIKHAPSYNRE